MHSTKKSGCGCSFSGGKSKKTKTKRNRTNRRNRRRMRGGGNGDGTMPVADQSQGTQGNTTSSYSSWLPSWLTWSKSNMDKTA